MIQESDQLKSTALSVVQSIPLLSQLSSMRSTIDESNKIGDDVRGVLIRISVSTASTAATLGTIATMLRAYIKRKDIELDRSRYAELEASREQNLDTRLLERPSPAGEGGFSLADFISSTPLILGALTGLALAFLPQEIKENLKKYATKLLLGATGLDEEFTKLKEQYESVKSKIDEFLSVDMVDGIGEIVTDLSLVLAGLALIKTGKKPGSTGRRGGGKFGVRSGLGVALTTIGGASIIEGMTGGVSEMYEDIKNKIMGAIDITEAAEETPPTERAKKAFDFFVSKGYTPEQSAGIVGNLQAESGVNLDPTATGDNGTAYGIAQWRGSRQDDFKAKYSKDIKESTFDEQLDFIIHELNNKESAANTALKQAKTASQAANVFSDKYERPNKKYARPEKRQGYAENILLNYNKQKSSQSNNDRVSSAPVTSRLAASPGTTTGAQLMVQSRANEQAKENAGSTTVTTGSLPASVSNASAPAPRTNQSIPMAMTMTPDLDRAVFFSLTA